MRIVFKTVVLNSLQMLGFVEANSAQKFTWTQRMSAAIGIAKGIQFLHTGIVPGIFSNQLKITDVLLDQNFHVKISKYNLPLLIENKKMVCKPLFSTIVSINHSFRS